MNRRVMLAARTWAAVSSVVLLSLTLAAPQARGEVYVSGHADLGVGFENNQLHLHLHAENTLGLFGGGTKPAGEYEPGELYIGIPGAPIARPAGAQWNFLAANAGDSVWFLPQSSDPAKPFLGIGTEELLPAEWTTPLTWTFNSISTISGAPASFALWQELLGTPTVIASSLTPTPGVGGVPNSWTQGADSHDHFNFGFSGEGVYEVSLSISGTKIGANAGTYSDTAVFRFATGNAIATVPEPHSLMMVGYAVVGCLAYRRRAG